MKPLYIMTLYSDAVRRERATHEEIREVVAGRSNDRLVRIEIGTDGDIVTHELTADELKVIADGLAAAYAAELRSVLDDAARLVRKVRHLDGISVGTWGAAELRSVLDDAVRLVRKVRHLDGISVGTWGALTIWIERTPNADHIALAWAEEHGYEVKRSSPPATAKRWYPDATVFADGVDVVRMVWPEVEVNTDKAIDEEVAIVRAERATAAQELEAF